jgi:hypothetical protein
MKVHFEAVNRRLRRLPEGRASFETSLFINIAGVLFAGKAGELLTLTPEKWGMDMHQQAEVTALFASSFHVSCQTLYRNGHCARVLIYDPGEVRKTLSRTPRWFFEKMDYQPGVEPACFIQEVSRRWRANDHIPHEIGLALGYPVKDVLGYMGLVPLPCTGTCGWRIHGNPAPSLRRSRRYKRARERAVALLSAASGYGAPGRAVRSIPAVRMPVSRPQPAEMASTGQ